MAPSGDDATAMRTFRKKRGVQKGKLTSFEKFLGNLPDSQELTPDELTDLENRFQRLSSILDEFESYQAEIIVLVQEEEREAEEKEGSDFEDRYYTAMRKAKQLLKSQTPVPLTPLQNPAPTASTNANGGCQGHQATKRNVKLPTIELPTFDGKFENWLEFKDAFNNLIHSDPALADAEKLYYLKSCLKGDAAESIKDAKLTNANYSSVYQLLLDHYDNDNLVIYHHLEGLFETPSITKESHEGLRKIYNNINKNLRALSELKEPTDKWDTLLIHIIFKKLDPTSQREWEEFKYAGRRPTMNDMNNFLRQRCQLLEKMQQKQTGRTDRPARNRAKSYAGVNKPLCAHCEEEHIIYYCDEFLGLKINERIKSAQEKKLCLNCLKPNHIAKECRMSRCRKCDKAHNTLLHLEFNEAREDNDSSQESETSNVFNTGSTSYTSNHPATYPCHPRSENMLATAVVEVRCGRNQWTPARVFLDSGAQSNFITERFCRRINAVRKPVDHAVAGIGQTLTLATGRAEITFTNRDDCWKKPTYTNTIDCLIMNQIVDDLPTKSFDASKLEIPANITLADPYFNERREIDILLGAEVFWKLLSVGQIHLGKNGPILQKTLLGWVFVGKMNIPMPSAKSLNCLSTRVQPADSIIKRFWELEHYASVKPPLCQADQACENIFKETYKRDDNGKFIVSIPLKGDLSTLGDTMKTAKNRFLQLEHKFERNITIKKEYVKFMREYEELGHMTEVTKQKSEETPVCYLPHHAVLRESSLTTKCRVVFDGSAKSSTGVSINDLQHKGPTIQSDIFDILLRFRTHKYVLSADISKMYRQVLIAPEQRSLQRIFWRETPDVPLKIYELNTVTYGTTSAPFLAVRCLEQLAADNERVYPDAANIIRSDIYVDDTLTGDDTKSGVVKIQKEITSILASGGFVLRKWLTNEPSLLKQFQIQNDVEASVVNLGDDENNKTLGIFWNPKSDTIEYSVAEIDKKANTKRAILSATGQIFDPLGLVAPIIIRSKLIIQELWQLGLTWDEAIPQNLHHEWIQLRKDLKEIEQLKIPRYVSTRRGQSTELHMFCDASERAYGACAYFKTKDGADNVSINLVCAKTRVAPLNQISLPRLELCGAVLAANLGKRVVDGSRLKIEKIYYWTDSAIVLCWIKNSARNFQTFVANRVGEIHQLTDANNWSHIKSEENPADLLSRGVTAHHIKESELWWHGPSWLVENKSDWPKSQCESIPNDRIPEMKPVKIMSMAAVVGTDIFRRFSTLHKLIKSVSFQWRFINNARKQKEDRRAGRLNATDRNDALNLLVRLSQKQAFPDDYKNLETKKPLKGKSKLLCLNPFLDENGIIRVGGRLSNSDFAYHKKHPMVLGHDHIFTKMVLTSEHRRLLHCGAQQLLASIREMFWPIGGRNMCKAVIRNCIGCFKANPKPENYLMGNLPSPRLKCNPPFTVTGVDYAGPILIKDRKLRGAKEIKAWICIFVCVVTKAVHIDLVTSAEADAFLAVLRRFIARRGKPSDIHSDNGTNFIGTDNDLKELYEFLEESEQVIADKLLEENINWHFIPPAASHFGGLWEAGVKSAKYHLKRIVKGTKLTYEDMQTVLTQIEAVLNSRPLSPLSSDPNDFNPLTPGHFLIGRALTSLPETDLSEIAENRLDKYQVQQKICQDFWERWHREYISELQLRLKWKTKATTLLRVNSLVMIKEDNTPPFRWRLARVTRLHVGKDNIARVATVRFSTGQEMLRPLKKLCVLPTEVDNDNTATQV